ncbi:antitoxin [Thermococcus profundus]|uniref:Antitoxin n=1 Tax=Thermococcus profundus TaxID=49899 RepID=A0A2Z2MJ17_THEPR|nr:antitoxin VapB family protein [Thermococcus profundus]ASJ01948.1 antitoxin [Thermococcus profundus]
MVKTITAPDDVYSELLRIKGNNSFDDLFRELLNERKENTDALRHIAGILSEGEYKEAKKRVNELNEMSWGKT